MNKIIVANKILEAEFILEEPDDQGKDIPLMPPISERYREVESDSTIGNVVNFYA